MRIGKMVAAAAVATLLALPALAVFNEKDLPRTLSVLRYELHQEVLRRESREGRVNFSDRSQHTSLVSTIKKCNELSLMLYSQNQDCTFDMTYALKEVTREYEDFQNRRLPFDDLVTRFDLEIDRYSRLVESLRRLPPQLRKIEDLPDSLAYHNDSIKPVAGMFGPRPGSPMPEGAPRFRLDSLNANGHKHTFYLDDAAREDRDSCIAYATTILKMYSAMKDKVVADSEHYEDASTRLKESYDYAQNRYRVLQKRVFTSGQGNYFNVIGHFPLYFRRAVEDAATKYSTNVSEDRLVSRSEWRGPIVLGFMGMMLLCLLAATALSIVLMLVLKRFVRALGSDSFIHRRRTVIQLCGVVLFAIAVWVASRLVSNNFFEVASQQLLIYSWLLAATLFSLLVRVSSRKLRPAVQLFMPLCVIGFIVIGIRIMFVPNSMINLLFPILLLLFSVWQAYVCAHNNTRADGVDRLVSYITLVILIGSTVVAWAGYVLLSVLVVIWWLFQVAAVETIIAAFSLLDRYENGRLAERVAGFKASGENISPVTGKGRYVRVTWLFDFVKMVVVPVAAVLSVPFAVWLALDVFDLTEIYHNAFRAGFFDLVDKDGNQILKISAYMIVLSVALFFVFKYMSYVINAVYAELKVRRVLARSGRSHVLANEVNLTLAGNVISILVWGLYIILLVLLLKIPTGAISIVAAGLATGLGLAMKDILNNFIYGIQLMSGRLRVGDWMECDGVRGKVTAISYQSTQIETVDGAVMSFLNTALFSKNFKNLTRNNSYEFVKIAVGVGYGTDIRKAREVILAAVEALGTEDHYGRSVLDPSRSVSVAFEDFGESSVDLCVKQYVLVSERYAYVARAKEAIYDALNDAGIEIPFPQRDVHIIR